MQHNTVNILEKAGWYPNRQTNIDGDVTFLKENGYKITGLMSLFKDREFSNFLEYK